MNKKQMLLLGLVIMFSALLIGCGGKKEKQVLNLYSWADNFNPAVIADFEQKYNCKVNYDVFANNEEMLAKIQAGGSQYDLIQPSDYMVQTMIKLNLLEELRKDNLPNLKNMTTYFKTPPYDPQGKYSVVYAWGVTGIAYNKKYVKQTPESWNSLWNTEYKGKVIMLNDSREVIGMGLKKNGYSNSSRNDAEIEMAVNDLKKVTPNVLAFDTDTIKQKFIAEEGWIGTMWSGDAVFVNKDNKDIAFVVPKEGSTIWADTFAIPKGAKNRDLAEKFINYMYDTKVSVKNYEEIGYINPSEVAFKMHSEAYRNNPIIKEALKAVASSEWLADIGDKVTTYDRYWTEIRTGK